MAFDYLREMLEILDEELVRTDIQDKKYNGTFGDAKTPAKRTELGRGLFSRVNTTNDPHTVRKTTVNNIGPNHRHIADGFEGYVRMLNQFGAMDNIHFPKVYKAKNSVDREGTRRHQFEMEKLQPIDSLSKEELEALVDASFNAPVYKLAKITQYLRVAVDRPEDRDRIIKSESLAEACKILTKIAREGDFILDIHAGNFMVRRTPYGPQLVISDPFGLLKPGREQKYGGPEGVVDAGSTIGNMSTTEFERQLGG
jgi:hypothetical protein